MSGERDDAEGVAARGRRGGREIVGAPEADGLVEGAGEEEGGGAGGAGSDPRGGPYGVVVAALRRFDARQLHLIKSLLSSL